MTDKIKELKLIPSNDIRVNTMIALLMMIC